MYVCKTLFTDASLVNKIVGFHKGRQTIKKKSQGRYLQKVGVIRLNINHCNKDLLNLTDY